MGYGYHTAYAPLSDGDESPESDGPTLAEAFRAALPESLLPGRRPDPSLRTGDIEMNPVQAHHETLRPLILPEAVESGSVHGHGQVPEVRVEPDTATATTAVTTLDDAHQDQDQVQHAAVAVQDQYRTQNQNQNGEGPAENDDNDWSVEQDARMKDILNASIQAAVAEGKREMSSPSSVRDNEGSRDNTGKQAEKDELPTGMVVVDKKGKGKGKGKAAEYEVPSILKNSGNGGGGGNGGGDAVDRLLGEWTTLRVSGSPAGHGEGDTGTASKSP